MVKMFVLLSNQHKCWGSAFQAVAKPLPADGTEWMNPLFFFVCTCSFWFPYLTVIISIHVFSPSFYFLPVRRRGNEWQAGYMFSCWPGSTHRTLWLFIRVSEYIDLVLMVVAFCFVLFFFPTGFYQTTFC